MGTAALCKQDYITSLEFIFTQPILYAGNPGMAAAASLREPYLVLAVALPGTLQEASGLLFYGVIHDPSVGVRLEEAERRAM